MSLAPLLRPQPLRLATCRSFAPGRFSSTSLRLPPLPPHDQWRAIFGATSVPIRDRVSIANPETAYNVAESFLAGRSIAAGKGKTIIESFPGPGALSRALLRLDSSYVEKLIILEEHERYLEYLRPLEQDPRVTVVPLSGFSWETYNLLEERGLLDHIKKLTYEDGIHPQLHFISHIPQNVKGEQLIAQLFRNIPERTWLFKYGRVPMSFILGEWIWERASAVKATSPRCKVSVIAEATADMQSAIRPSLLQPYNSHFHPMKSVNSQEKKPESRRLGQPLLAVNAVPHAEQIIQLGKLEKWDYVLRRLFVLKSTPLKKAIGSLALGAESLLKVLTNPSLPPEQRVDVSTPIRALTVNDWVLIVRAFDNWPFAPNTLEIDDSFFRKSERHMG